MPVPMLRSILPHRVLFLGAAGVVFAILATVIFALPKRVQIRSLIEVGTAAEAPDVVARRISVLYAPSVVLAIAGRAQHPPALSGLLNSSVESIGGSVLIVSTIPVDMESDAKLFQQGIIDLFIKDSAPHAQALRENIASRIDWNAKSSESIKRQIRSAGQQIARIDAITDNLQRELREPTSSHSEASMKLLLERLNLARDVISLERQRISQAAAVASVKLEESRYKDTQVLQAPTLMPIRSVWNRPILILLALVISILVAFGTVVLVVRASESRI